MTINMVLIERPTAGSLKRFKYRHRLSAPASVSHRVTVSGVRCHFVSLLPRNRTRAVSVSLTDQPSFCQSGGHIHASRRFTLLFCTNYEELCNVCFNTPWYSKVPWFESRSALFVFVVSIFTRIVGQRLNFRKSNIFLSHENQVLVREVFWATNIQETQRNTAIICLNIYHFTYQCDILKW
jgi:hypothetical protein